MSFFWDLGFRSGHHLLLFSTVYIVLLWQLKPEIFRGLYRKLQGTNFQFLIQFNKKKRLFSLIGIHVTAIKCIWFILYKSRKCKGIGGWYYIHSRKDAGFNVFNFFMMIVSSMVVPWCDLVKLSIILNKILSCTYLCEACHILLETINSTKNDLFGWWVLRLIH